MVYTVKDVLSVEVAPALGCTEPIAVALGAAVAVALLPGAACTGIEVHVDRNVYKNGVAVVIPGSGGLTGLDTAAALGAVGGNPAAGLEVLETVDEHAAAKAREFLEAQGVEVILDHEADGLYVRTVVWTSEHRAESLIRGSHDNIVALKLDGEDAPLPWSTSNGGEPAGHNKLAEVEEWLRGCSLKALLELIETMDDDDRKFIEEGVQLNLCLAEYGLKYGSGLGVGRALERLARQRLIKRDMILAARILTASASDARMAGAPLPAMSSGGSGNHGLTAILPIWAVKDYLDCEHAAVIEAICLSHMITAYVKAHTGRLSAICGCSIAAGAGAAAGVAYLLGGTVHHIADAIKNVVGDLAGVICDGAKPGCSLKLATAAGVATQAALFAHQGVSVSSTDGIVGLSSEQTMQNVGMLSTEGMIEADRTILNIMLQKTVALE
ncbi:MAG: serine dehydratase subunit alpha family protein [Lentisphaeria bacterium]|nr:serine dehydratase subunit alpha family protein [Lentisphaeria bacterium]